MSDFPTLPKAQVNLLRSLVLRGPTYAFKLVRLSDGGLPRGSVYTLLQRLQRSGYIGSRQEPRSPNGGGKALRIYHVTALGTRWWNAYSAARDVWHATAQS